MPRVDDETLDYFGVRRSAGDRDTLALMAREIRAQRAVEGLAWNLFSALSVHSEFTPIPCEIDRQESDENARVIVAANLLRDALVNLAEQSQ